MAHKLEKLLNKLDNRYSKAFDNGMSWRQWQQATVSGRRYAQLRALYRKTGRPDA